MLPRQTSPGFRLFYGWYIVASCFAILFFNSGARFSIGVMFKPMIAEFGWNRASFSLAFFLNMTVYALSLTVLSVVVRSIESCTFLIHASMTGQSLFLSNFFVSIEETISAHSLSIASPR